MAFKRWLGSTSSSSGRNDPLSLAANTIVPESESDLDPTSKTINGSFDDDATNAALELPTTADSPSNPDYPFGDGSDKTFGMENFGYTCYCNSIVQCLYYTREFRLAIVKYPIRELNSRERKTTMPGMTPHPSLELSQIQAPESPTEELEVKSKTTFSRRTSNFFGIGKKTTNDDEAEGPSDVSGDRNGSTGAASQLQPSNVILIPNIHDSNSKVIIGETSDPLASIDARKRSALIKGPVLNVDHSLNSYGVKESLFTALKDVFEAMIENESNVGVVSPSYLVETLKRENELFRSTMHQDAHEFLNFTINNVIDTLNAHAGSSENVVHNLFKGVLTNQTKCLTCENLTDRNETFLDLSIDLTDNETLERCLKQFSAKEMLNGSNKFYCDSCHSLQEAEKRMGLNQLPKVLALHLKRFKYSEEFQRNVKLFHNIKYPPYLELMGDIPDDNNEYMKKFYELSGVVVHIGGGPQHGHYVALVKTSHLGWLLFDDETVEKIDEKFVLKFVGDGKDLATAYVLFYQEISKESFEELTTATSTEDLRDKESGFGGINQKFTFNTMNKHQESDLAYVSPLEANPLETPLNPVSDTSSKKLASNIMINENSSNPALDKLRTKSSSSITWLKKTTGNSDMPNVGQTPHIIVESSTSSQPSATSTFWKREKKEAGKKNEDKDDNKLEKKRNRMSMSFSFKKSG